MMTTTFRRTDSPASESDRGKVIPTVSARQGVTGHNVRYILYVSTAVAAFILAVVWFLYFTS
ncbi:MAG TPA: hypothetical protein PKA74_15095 [Bauldia sp.]|nr:hypothetical protein [Bauldia sp.]